MDNKPLNSEYIHQKIAEATRQIYNIYLQGIPEKSVIFFDIDDTLIYSYTNILITPVYNFYNWIKTIGIIPIIITARPGTSDSIQYTIEQLKMLGISDYKYLYLREVGIQNIEHYKMKCRKSIYDQGYNVLMSIGDMYWDGGEYGGISILIK